MGSSASLRPIPNHVVFHHLCVKRFALERSRMARECHGTSRRLGQVAYPSKHRRSCSHNEHNRKFSDLYPDTTTGLRKALEAVRMI